MYSNYWFTGFWSHHTEAGDIPFIFIMPSARTWQSLEQSSCSMNTCGMTRAPSPVGDTNTCTTKYDRHENNKDVARTLPREGKKGQKPLEEPFYLCPCGLLTWRLSLFQILLLLFPMTASTAVSAYCEPGAMRSTHITPVTLMTAQCTLLPGKLGLHNETLAQCQTSSGRAKV